MAKQRIITEKQKEYYDNQRKEYNKDKTYVQVLKSTHALLKDYCSSHDLVMKDFINELILKNIQ